jgi:hypothetical protein
MIKLRPFSSRISPGDLVSFVLVTAYLGLVLIFLLLTRRLKYLVRG